MQLKHLSDPELLAQTHEAVSNERAAITAVLYYIEEVESRLLYAAHYPSLFAWLTEELGYSEGQAQRRIDGARLLRQLPTLAVKLESGLLNLNHVSQAQAFFCRERKRGNQYSTVQIKSSSFWRGSRVNPRARLKSS